MTAFVSVRVLRLLLLLVLLALVPAVSADACTTMFVEPPVNVTVPGYSGATASALTGRAGPHFDTPTGVFVGPGDVLSFVSYSGPDSWCCYYANAAGSGVEFFAGHYDMALSSAMATRPQIPTTQTGRPSSPSTARR